MDAHKTILLAGEALAAAKDAALIWRNFYKSKDELEKRFQSQMQELYDRAMAQAKAQMDQVYALAGVAPDKKMNLDARYVMKHDVAFLVDPEHDESEQTEDQPSVN